MFVLRKGRVNRYSSRNKAGASSCFVELPILFSLIFWDIGKDKSSLSSSNVMFMMLKKMLLLNIHKFNDLRQHDPSFYQIEIDFSLVFHKWCQKILTTFTVYRLINGISHWRSCRTSQPSSAHLFQRMGFG